MAVTSLVRVLLAGLVGAFVAVSAPAFAKKDACSAVKTQADCGKKKECSWSGKACAKAAAAAKPAKKDADKKAAAAKGKKDPKAADKKKKPDEAKPAEDGMPPMDDVPGDAAAGDEDF